LEVEGLATVRLHISVPKWFWENYIKPEKNRSQWLVGKAIMGDNCGNSYTEQNGYGNSYTGQNRVKHLLEQIKEYKEEISILKMKLGRHESEVGEYNKKMRTIRMQEAIKRVKRREEVEKKRKDKEARDERIKAQNRRIAENQALLDTGFWHGEY